MIIKQQCLIVIICYCFETCYCFNYCFESNLSEKMKYVFSKFMITSQKWHKQVWIRQCSNSQLLRAAL